MKTLTGLVSLVLLHLVVSFGVVAQRPPDAPHTPPPYKRQDELAEERIQRIPNPVSPDSSSVKREPRVLTDGLLAPSWEDRYHHQEFLKQSKTGLIRLLPREVYDWQTYRTAPVRIETRGGGAYFSFFHRTHEYGFGSDLELDHKKFTVGFAGANYGMIADLGDVPIESISDTDPQFVFMSTYKPRTVEAEARSEFKRFRQGVTIDGFTYRRTTPAKAENTYLVRSIDFSSSDVLVAFRVSRFDSDGSAIIAWKLLKSFATPELKQIRLK